MTDTGAKCRCPCTCGHAHGDGTGTCVWCVAAQKAADDSPTLMAVQYLLEDLLTNAEAVVGSNYTLTLVARCRARIDDADIILTKEESLALPESSLRRFRQKESKARP